VAKRAAVPQVALETKPKGGCAHSVWYQLYLLTVRDWVPSSCVVR